MTSHEIFVNEHPKDEFFYIQEWIEADPNRRYISYSYGNISPSNEDINGGDFVVANIVVMDGKKVMLGIGAAKNKGAAKKSAAKDLLIKYRAVFTTSIVEKEDKEDKVDKEDNKKGKKLKKAKKPRESSKRIEHRSQRFGTLQTRGGRENLRDAFFERFEKKMNAESQNEIKSREEYDLDCILPFEWVILSEENKIKILDDELDEYFGKEKSDRDFVDTEFMDITSSLISISEDTTILEK